MIQKLLVIISIVLILIVGCTQKSLMVGDPSATVNLTQLATEIFIQPGPENTPEKPIVTAITTPTTAPIIPPLLGKTSPPETITPDDLNVKPGLNPFYPLFQNPISLNYQQEIDRSYPYGARLEGEILPHDGVEFYNTLGTPVLAAQDGKVFFVGNDHETQWGRFKDFYGNMIILEHMDTQTGFLFYTLYAHLSETFVPTGKLVQSGEQIGTVGASGAAFGSHLHFEVRFYEPRLENTVNPELYMELIETEKPGGLLAGIIVGSDGHLLEELAITIQPVINGEVDNISDVRYIKTYSGIMEKNSSINENFAIGNIPIGDYRITTYIDNVFYEKFIEIKQDSLTYIIFKPE